MSDTAVESVEPSRSSVFFRNPNLSAGWQVPRSCPPGWYSADSCSAMGYFEVTGRDGESSGEWGSAGSPYKKVRVVTTVDFYLR